MKTDRELMELALAKRQEAVDLLEVVCLRHHTCAKCPLSTRSDSATPGSGEDMCLYHKLATDCLGAAWKMCPACKRFYEGVCSAEQREDYVDYEVACPEYKQKTTVDERLQS